MMIHILVSHWPISQKSSSWSLSSTQATFTQKTKKIVSIEENKLEKQYYSSRRTAVPVFKGTALTSCGIPSSLVTRNQTIPGTFVPIQYTRKNENISPKRKGVKGRNKGQIWRLPRQTKYNNNVWIFCFIFPSQICFCSSLYDCRENNHRLCSCMYVSINGCNIPGRNTRSGKYIYVRTYDTCWSVSLPALQCCTIYVRGSKRAYNSSSSKSSHRMWLCCSH